LVRDSPGHGFVSLFSSTFLLVINNFCDVFSTLIQLCIIV
jgi:hypothetical protein